jgi:ribosome-binding protein aMBF1 (putative translation factor)
MRGESSFSLERLDEVAAKLNLVVCHSDARPDAIAEVVKTAGSPKSRQLMRELFNVNLPEPNPPSAAEVPDGVVADSLGAFLRSHRVRRQWSQEYVATKAGLGGGRAQLSRFETNEHTPRWSTLQRLAAVLEFDPEPWKQGLKAARGQQS